MTKMCLKGLNDCCRRRTKPPDIACRALWNAQRVGYKQRLYRRDAGTHRVNGVIKDSNEKQREAQLQVAYGDVVSRSVLQAELEQAAVASIGSAVAVVAVAVPAVVGSCIVVGVNEIIVVAVEEHNATLTIVVVKLLHRAEKNHSHHAQSHYGEPLLHQPTKLQPFVQLCKQIAGILLPKATNAANVAK